VKWPGKPGSADKREESREKRAARREEREESRTGRASLLTPQSSLLDKARRLGLFVLKFVFFLRISDFGFGVFGYRFSHALEVVCL